MAVLLCAAAVPAHADSYFYGAVNYQLFPCEERYMPVLMSTDDPVIPAKLLVDSGLGIRGTYDAELNRYTLSDGVRTLTFDMKHNIAFDGDGNEYVESALQVYSIFYLPLYFTTAFFDLTYKFIDSSYGTVLRIQYRYLESTDQDFLNVINTQLSRQVARYREINGTTTPPPVSPAPGESPPPTTAPEPQIQLSFDFAEVSALTSVSAKVGTDTTLDSNKKSADSPTTEMFEEVLALLKTADVPATFFLTGSAMSENQQVLRQIVGEGHAVGVLGGDNFLDATDQMLGELQAANEVLHQGALIQTRLVRPAGGSETMTEDLRDALVGAGYRLWDWTLDIETTGGKSNKVVTKLLQRIDESKGRPIVLRMAGDNYSLEVLTLLLQELADRDAEFSLITQTHTPQNFHRDIR